MAIYGHHGYGASAVFYDEVGDGTLNTSNWVWAVDNSAEVRDASVFGVVHSVEDGPPSFDDVLDRCGVGKKHIPSDHGYSSVSERPLRDAWEDYGVTPPNKRMRVGKSVWGDVDYEITLNPGTMLPVEHCNTVATESGAVLTVEVLQEAYDMLFKTPEPEVYGKFEDDAREEMMNAIAKRQMEMMDRYLVRMMETPRFIGSVGSA